MTEKKTDRFETFIMILFFVSIIQTILIRTYLTEDPASLLHQCSVALVWFSTGAFILFELYDLWMRGKLGKFMICVACIFVTNIAINTLSIPYRTLLNISNLVLCVVLYISYRVENKRKTAEEKTQHAAG